MIEISYCANAIIVLIFQFARAYWRWADLNQYGLSSGSWIDIDPQRLIDEQGTENYFSQWSLEATIDIS